MNPLRFPTHNSFDDSKSYGLLHNIEVAKKSLVATGNQGIKYMHPERQKTQQNMQNNVDYPKVISKASLIALKNWDHSPLAPASPEILKLVEEKELGFHIVEDIGVNAAVSNLSAASPDFVPSFTYRKKREPKQASEEEEELVVVNLKYLIRNVLAHPGSFDNLSAVFVNRVMNFLYSEETVNKMVKVIFMEAMTENNFKYLGAKLCDKLMMPNVLKNFRTNFLNHFQAEFKMTHGLQGQNESTDKIRGFVMFMAELFMHIKVNSAPFTSLGRSLTKLLERLLAQPTLKNITFVCKVLKLIGATLFDAFQNNDTDIKSYQKIFAVLKEISEKQVEAVEDAVKIRECIRSVLCLKHLNWGRTELAAHHNFTIDDFDDSESDIDYSEFVSSDEETEYDAEYERFLAESGQLVNDRWSFCNSNVLYNVLI